MCRESSTVAARSILLGQPKFARTLFGPALAAALLLTARLSHAEGVAMDAASPAQKRQAARELAKGQKLLKAGKLEEALAALTKAHDIMADPEARLFIARARQNGGDLIQALNEYTATIAEARALARQDAKYQATLDAAQRELKELEGVVAKVTIRLRYAPPGTKVDIDGDVIPPAKLGDPIVLPPGLVRITARTPDGLETDRQLTLTAGQDAKVELAFPRDSAAPPLVEEGVPHEAELPGDAESSQATVGPGSGKRTAAFVAGGVGLAGLAAFGVFGALSNSRYHRLEDACVAGRCPTESQSDIDQGKRFQTLANVGLAVGIVGIGASAALFVWSSRSTNSAEGDSATSRLELGIGLASVRLRGSFQ